LIVTAIGNRWSMTALVVLLLILALLIGGLGLLIKGLAWLLIIALILLAASAISGVVGHHRAA
jgi:hypothetical protein